ncbi:MAG: zinc ribbon domain-containing protein, partial [Pseudomonadota bacterium]
MRGIAACASCGTPLRSSWSTGSTKRYAYFLCQTKGCEAYGKSIPRDRIEGDVGALLKKLAPTENVIALAKAMFRQAWDQRVTHARAAVTSAKSQLTAIDKQIDGLLTRVLDATNATVIRSYESKISALEKEKATLADQLAHHAEPARDFDEKLELTLRFIANPWKLWEKGNHALRRTLLKLAFAGRIAYCRNKGARTPEITLPFKALGGLEGKGV